MRVHKHMAAGPLPPPGAAPDEMDVPGRIGAADLTRVNLGPQLYDVGHVEGKPVAVWRLIPIPNGANTTHRAYKIWNSGKGVDFMVASILEVARRRRMA